MNINQAGKRGWAALIYSCTPADLSQGAQVGRGELLASQPDDQVSLSCQLGSKDQVVRRSGTPLGPPQQEGKGEMSSAQELGDFLQWSRQQIPDLDQRKIMLVLGGHGAGFMGAVTNTKGNAMLSLQGIQQGMALGGIKPELLVFNACQMATAEVLGLQAQHLAASQTEMFGGGLPLKALLERLHQAENGQQAGRMLVEETRKVPDRVSTFSSLSPQAKPQLGQALDQLGYRLASSKHLIQPFRAQVAHLPSLAEDPLERPRADLIDLGQLAQGLQRQPNALAQAGEQLEHALGGVVLDHSHSSAYPFAEGLSAYLPLTSLSLTHPGPQAQHIRQRYAQSWLAQEAGGWQMGRYLIEHRGG